MEKNEFGIKGKSNTPLQIDKTINLDDQYITLFTTKQIKSNHYL